MRTTITLEDDVAASLKRLGKGRGLKFKDLVNLALREGLKHLAKPTKPRKPFHTRAVDLGLCRTANVDNIGEILAVAEGESFK
jgi:hypothetical protein